MSNPSLKSGNVGEKLVGHPGLTAAIAEAMAEAAAVCLEVSGHRNGVRCERWLRRKGRSTSSPEDSAVLCWKELPANAHASWNDLQEATEYGAYALAALQARDHLGKVIIRRSRIGTSFDFWLGDAEIDPASHRLFQASGRLEVSGILRGRLDQCERRIREKLEQIRPAEEPLPGFVAVVEFGRPCSWTVEK